MEKLNQFKHYFASRYIVDVIIDEKYIKLKDSSQGIFYIDKDNKNIINQFKYWFKNVFSKGISGTLTVIEYEKYSLNNEIICNIKHFINLSFN